MSQSWADAAPDLGNRHRAVGGGGEAYDGSQFYVRPAFNQPLRPAVEEQIAAILEGRKFDVSHVGPGTDSVCHTQRGGLEAGVRFRIDDQPGMDASQSADADP